MAQASTPWTEGSAERLIPTPVGPINIRHGGKADGPAMVFWPSLLMNGAMWRQQYEHFAPTHRVVLIDSPGIGKSAPLRTLIDLEDCAACVVAILDALDIHTCLFVGVSWGGMLASLLPVWHPERLDGAVVISGTASSAAAEEIAQMTELATALEASDTAPPWLVPATQAAFAGTTAEATKPEFMASIGTVLDEDPVSIAFAIKGVLLRRQDRHALLRTIETVPVLVLAGEEDRQFPVAAVRALAEAIPRSRFVTLPGTGHLPPLESPDLVNAEIDAFVARLATARG